MKRRRKVNKKKVILFILIIIILVIGSIFIVSKLFDKEVVPSDNIIDKDNNKESIVMYLVCISFFKISLLFNIKSVHLPSDNLI